MGLLRYLKGRSYWIGMKRLRSQHGRLTCGLILTLIFFATYTLLENSGNRLKDYYRRKNILPIVRLADYETEDAQSAKKLYPRQILFWTSLLQEGDGLRAFCMKSKQLQNCPYKCDFTTDRSYFEIADAVVFNCKSLQLKKKSLWESIWSGLSDEHDDIPEFRMHHQFWIFHMMESPSNTWINLKPFEGLFNWTMSYRRDSDVHTPYGRLIPRRVQDPKENITISSIHGRKLAAWIVSNCQYEPSGGKEYVEKLQKHITIDIYGKCGSFNCTSYTGICEDPLTCYKAISSKYKFFLAFENSLCEDYITDKFYNALRFGMVPIVFGYGDYSKVSPKSSYIDARSFESPEKLAEYLLFLDSHPEEYIKYLDWKKSYKVSDIYYFEDSWCTLCEKLWKTPVNSSYEDSPSARDLENWWYHSSESPYESACLHSMWSF